MPRTHRLCRECLLSSWWTSSAGVCPICRQLLKKSDLITCPAENKYRVDVEKNWKESSKVAKLLGFLEKIRESSSGENSIIFNQWTSFLDLLEILPKRKRIGSLRFDGKLAQKQRERVLKEFYENREKMTSSNGFEQNSSALDVIKSRRIHGGFQRWIPAVEEQAITRIHRIGQKQTVSVRRFIVKDSVEERMQQVRSRKQRTIVGAFTEEEL